MLLDKDEVAFDERGNVAQRLDASGSVLSSDLYSAYGMLLNDGTLGNGTGDGGDVFGYGAQSGYYTDPETKLVLCGQRYYQPSLGRWLNRAPIGYAGGQNLYAFCDNNPIMNADPSGLLMMRKNDFQKPPEPQLVGDPSRRTTPRVGRAVALMAGGIAAPIATAWLSASVLHLSRWNYAVPWEIQWAVTVLSLGCEVGAVRLGWRARAASVGPGFVMGFVMGVAGLAAVLLLVFAVAGALRLASMLGS